MPADRNRGNTLGVDSILDKGIPSDRSNPGADIPWVVVLHVGLDSEMDSGFVAGVVHFLTLHHLAQNCIVAVHEELLVAVHHSTADHNQVVVPNLVVVVDFVEDSVRSLELVMADTVIVSHSHLAPDSNRTDFHNCVKQSAVEVFVVEVHHIPSVILHCGYMRTHR